MGRRVNYLRRTTLDQFKGLEGCYIEWRPMTYGEKSAWTESTEGAKTDAEAIAIGTKLIQDQFVSGKLRFEGEPELVDASADDVAELPVEIVDVIFADITGVRYDPDPLGVTQTAESSSSEDSNATEPQTTTKTTGTQ